MPIHPAYDSETNSLVYHVIPEPPTGAESISDIVSETESSASGMTILSDEVLDYFVEHHGQQQPASENAVRWFPTDNTRRYILRHVVDKYMHGQNYAAAVGDMLRSNPGKGKQYQVLEIGTRDGTWTQEMATEFPHVQFRSLDIAPIMAHAPRPNIVFEVYDITEGLLLDDNSQDVVFVNLAIELVRDYRALLLEVHRVLRPGGVIHIHEYAPGLWDSQDESKPALRTNPIGCHHFDLIQSVITKLGVDPELCEKLPMWLSPGSDLWKVTSKTSGFEQIRSSTKVWPVRPHDRHPCSSKIDPRFVPLIVHLFVVCIRDSFGMLREAGLSVEDANSLIEEVIEESRDPEKCSLFKLYTIYATKRVEH